MALSNLQLGPSRAVAIADYDADVCAMATKDLPLAEAIPDLPLAAAAITGPVRGSNTYLMSPTTFYEGRTSTTFYESRTTTLQEHEKVNGIVFSPDGKKIAYTCGNMVKIVII